MVSSSRLRSVDGKLYTLDAGDGRPVYGEGLMTIDGKTFREWVPWRSKLAALIRKIGPDLPISGDVLYLGAAQGTTVSHISDLLEEGTIFAVEFSETAFRKLSVLAGKRANIIPILEDAFHPERYRAVVPPVDLLYQDVSQKEQLKLFLLNSGTFLKRRGTGILMLKSRSVDVTARPEDVYEIVTKGLEDNGFDVRHNIGLDPFQVDHSAIVVTKE
ncbi:MAG: fibrillarin-like rRNA/tRNA 2'-O-methyltransferase [Thermoplasmatota archaeon]